MVIDVLSHDSIDPPANDDVDFAALATHDPSIGKHSSKKHETISPFNSLTGPGPSHTFTSQRQGAQQRIMRTSRAPHAQQIQGITLHPDATRRRNFNPYLQRQTSRDTAGGTTQHQRLKLPSDTDTEVNQQQFNRLHSHPDTQVWSDYHQQQQQLQRLTSNPDEVGSIAGVLQVSHRRVMRPTVLDLQWEKKSQPVKRKAKGKTVAHT